MIFCYYYEKNKKLMPDKYGRFDIIFRKLDKFKTQDKAKKDKPDPYYWIEKL